VALLSTCVAALAIYAGVLIDEGLILYAALCGFLAVFIMITAVNYYLR
jgi:hypothetical protein